MLPSPALEMDHPNESFLKMVGAVMRTGGAGLLVFIGGNFPHMSALHIGAMMMSASLAVLVGVAFEMVRRK